MWNTIGGTLIGTGFGGITSAFANNARDKEMWTRLEGGIPESSFTTTDTALSKYRRSYHIYRITEDASGQTMWVHKTLNFRGHQSGKIQAKYELNDREYKVEGFLKRDTLILCSSPTDPTDREIQSVAVYHDFTTGFSKTYCGVLMLQTWSSRRCVSPSIISTDVLFDITQEGFVTQQEQAAKLDDLWSRTMESNSYRLLPRSVAK